MKIKILRDRAYSALCDRHIVEHPLRYRPKKEEGLEEYWSYCHRGFDRIFEIVSKYGENLKEDYDSNDFATYVVNDGTLFVVVNVYNPEACTPELIRELYEYVKTNQEGFTVALEIEDFDQILILKDRIVAIVGESYPTARNIIKRFNRSRSV